MGVAQTLQYFVSFGHYEKKNSYRSLILFSKSDQCYHIQIWFLLMLIYCYVFKYDENIWMHAVFYDFY